MYNTDSSISVEHFNLRTSIQHNDDVKLFKKIILNENVRNNLINILIRSIYKLYQLRVIKNSKIDLIAFEMFASANIKRLSVIIRTPFSNSIYNGRSFVKVS